MVRPLNDRKNQKIPTSPLCGVSSPSRKALRMMSPIHSINISILKIINTSMNSLSNFKLHSTMLFNVSKQLFYNNIPLSASSYFENLCAGTVRLFLPGFFSLKFGKMIWRLLWSVLNANLIAESVWGVFTFFIHLSRPSSRRSIRL